MSGTENTAGAKVTWKRDAELGEWTATAGGTVIARCRVNDRVGHGYYGHYTGRVYGSPEAAETLARFKELVQQPAGWRAR